MALEYLTSREAAERWQISARRVGVLCADGRIEGAVKKGRMWLIPGDAEKPADNRFKSPATDMFLTK